MKYITNLVLFILFTTVTLESHAEQIIACGESCSSMNIKARNEARWMYNGQIFSVIDTRSFEVRSYKSIWKWSFGEEFFDRAQRISTTYSGNSALNQLISAKNSLDLAKVRLPSNLPNTGHNDEIESVYQIFLQPQLETNISAYINQNMSNWEQIGAYGSAVLEIFNKIVDIDASIRVEFPDGSTALFVLKNVHEVEEGFDFEYLAGSARDTDGTKIPERGPDYIGDYYFSNDSNVEYFRELGERIHQIKFDLRNQCTATTTMTCNYIKTEVSCLVSYRCQ